MSRVDVTLTKDEMLDAITRQRLRLADTLEGLTEDEWNAPSLCEGWRVRDVVGHLLTILEIPIGRFLLNVVKARNFDRYANASAREFGTAEPKDLVARYRAASGKRFAPPIVGPIAPLADVMIHTRDVERPLGRPSTLHPTDLRTVLAYLCGGKARGFIPSNRTNGLQFVATDLGWSIGSGPTVTGTGEALMTAVSGRRVALDDLTGAGVETLRSRMA